MAYQSIKNKVLGTASPISVNDLQVTLLYVSDLQRAMDFYGTLLGLEKVYEYHGHAAYAIGSTRIMLSPRHPGHGEFADLPSGHQIGWGVAIYLGVEDVDAAIEFLRQNGVRVVEEPLDEPWGERDACVLDPDGYHIHLSESTPKSWLKHLPFIEGERTKA